MKIGNFSTLHENQESIRIFSLKAKITLKGLFEAVSTSMVSIPMIVIVFFKSEIIVLLLPSGIVDESILVTVTI